MRITIKTKNIILSNELSLFIERKIGVLKKFINILKQDIPEGKKTLAEVLVEAEKETMHHKKGKVFKSRIEITLPGKKLMAEARGDNLEGAIVDVKEQIKKEINKYKFKKIDKNRRKQRKLKKEFKI
ncbi:MAG: hypothetical protein A2402_03790 [Candidatus Staskawiczbacteria bacterium RIFOXYC1_FULL_37_43]|nr:MAG: hypothetical protein A2813_01480 [Candidatus Staskawiczbacteria bacterium RIFCSPHIGHO2_01_FULL_37_17]OGZ72070.1 MAG: hypothetical protein A2891_01505 [Candidatus Staskawiczbacteria bacterium RIFCSPLOWO2_01_FULL_37_19]OGZ75764.1 MAG: hypothetical protein A2205_02710 [Candidatus Staskawiczbacteria bacterium RIFOXYA1_FULL_37_15]OGZ77185.1 MAG: hypothetical protein A2280_02095 [Candidatus Staskawiczbacteria bacterium RIFOXYA12_FULL_37_10]OGZ80654.1 MAG: hypothetical protein A2353_00390 [Can